MKTRVRRGDEPEDVVVARPSVEERDHVVVDRVADVQAEYPGVERGHTCRLRREQQRVAQPARHHICGDVAPLRRADALPAGSGVREDFGDRSGGRLLDVEQLHRRTVRVADPHSPLVRATWRLDHWCSGPLQSLPHRVRRARVHRERHVVQPLDRALQHPHLFLPAAGAHGHECAVLLRGFQAKVLQEPVR
jgi:hypothetical protein